MDQVNLIVILFLSLFIPLAFVQYELYKLEKDFTKLMKITKSVIDLYERHMHNEKTGVLIHEKICDNSGRHTDECNSTEN